MRVGSRLAVLVAAVATALPLTGCHQLFGLEEIKPLDAEPPPPCEDPTPFGTQCRMLDLQLTNDTYLSAALPDTPLGSQDGVHISASDPALFKFNTSTIEAGERIAWLRLTLVPYYSNQAKLCNPVEYSCLTCPTPSIDGWSLHWTVTGWNQTATTWNLADEPGVRWASPGAAAIPDDRSDVVVSGPAPIPPAPLVIDVPSEALLARSPDCYRNDARLAVLVTLTGSGYFRASELNMCTGPGNPPMMQVMVCR